MNSENQVNGCMSSYVETTNQVCCGCVSEPARSVTPCTVPKFSPHPVQHYICSPQNCAIFGGHDYYPPVEICGRSRHKRNLNTLGSPIGLVKSSTPAKVEGQKGEMVRYATYLKAFAKIYLTPENDWNTPTIDQLLKEGQTLLQDSKNYVPEELELTVYSDAEIKILREFELGGCTFQVELNEKYESFISEIERNGDVPIPELTVEFLRFALKGFFRNRKYCLLKLGNWYLLVWRVRGVYFVFDCNGRRLNDLNLDREKGVAVLICLKHLDNVCHLLQNLSGLNKNDAVSLRELKVVKLVDTDGRTMTREYGKRTNQYEIISPDYAILRTNLHLSLNRAEVVRHRSALPVAVAALLASKIDHPALWTQKVLDKIICFGVNVCRCCWSQCESAQEAVQIEMFPPQLKIGQFIADYRIWGRKIEGTWKCIPNYVNGEFSNAIEKCFDDNSNNLIIQIESQFYAVWKKNNFFYLMDPFRHRVSQPPSTVDKSASLRMFRTLDILFQVFNQLLLESNKTSHFTIHIFKVRKLTLVEKQREGVPEGAAEAPTQELDEVKSLNEAVCFEEDEVKCLDELGEVSDYEDEDASDVVTIDLTEPKSESESESEEGMEEEEMGMEDFGEGYETSSSGDGGGHGKKKGRKGGKGKKTGKGDKGGKGGKGGKGDKSGKGDKNGKGGKTAKGDKGGKGKTKKGDATTKKPKGPKDAKDKNNKKKKKDTETDEQKIKKEKANKDKKDKNKSQSDKEAKDKIKKEKADSIKKEREDSIMKEEEDRKHSDMMKKEKESLVEEKNAINEANKHSIKKEIDDEMPTDSDTELKDKKSGGKHETDQGAGRDSKDGKDKGKVKGKDEKSDSESDGDREDGRTPGKCQPNNYPGYSSVAHDMAVVGSESGSYDSICKLLRAGFKCADRILTMTPWGNYVVFRGLNVAEKIYFLFDGCTCNVNRFRHLDLTSGTAGLLCFHNLHDVICYILDSQTIRTNLKKSRKNIVDEICKQYCK